MGSIDGKFSSQEKLAHIPSILHLLSRKPEIITANCVGATCDIAFKVHVQLGHD